TITRLHFIATRPINARSTFSGLPPDSTPWLSARAKYSGRQRKPTSQPANPEQQVRIYIVCFSGPSEWRNKCARTRKLRGAQYLLGRSPSIWHKESSGS